MTHLHLDTHVVVWLAGAQHHRCPIKVRAALNSETLRYSPMLRLELALLHEIGRLTEPADVLLAGLQETIGLRADDTDFGLVTQVAVAERFTRDPFDRIITAQARAASGRLATKNSTIAAAHPELTVWE